MLIDVLLVVGDDRLGDGLTDGVDLRGVTTTGDTDTDVDTGKLVDSDDQERFVDLCSSALVSGSECLPVPLVFQPWQVFGSVP